MPEREDGNAEPAVPSGLVGRSIEEFVNQMRAFTERARGLATGGLPSGLMLPTLPSPPGAMSAAQLRAVASAVHAQRQQMTAMRDQLEAFDQQLAVFEQILEPLVEWSATWARLEEGVASLGRREPGDTRSPRPGGRSTAKPSGEA
jgi:hypothetical protein